MEPYADKNYYRTEYEGIAIPEEDREKALKQATRHIDTLTFRRIKSVDELTPYQQEVVKTCCCRLAEFEYENSDVIESILQSYSINGVSMSFGESWNVKVINGIAMPRDIYSYLRTTGLCCRVVF